ncbi:MAG: FAD-linked oxidase C-terminal domain-containing protein [bacterium]|nr:FAD-linked oxidase C-terminal domain-containing protein [bacterium]
MPVPADRLASIVGESNLLTDPAAVEPYGRDESSCPSHPPAAVVRPGSTEEVRRILRLAGEQGFAVTPRGLGTGLCGGAVPVQGGVVLSLERMNRILEIDESNLAVTVEPGVVLQDLHRAVEARGLFYPPDPASLESCSIGGNLAVNAGGPRAAKYGITRHYVVGMEMVLAGGEVVSYGGKVIKNTTGYSLPHFLVGSEGTLGVITRATLRLIPLPRERVDLLAPFASVGAAARAVGEIVLGKRVIPAAVEFMDRASLRASATHLGRELPHLDAAAHLLVQLDGNHPAEVQAQAEQVAELCQEHGAWDVLVATGSQTQERLWAARRAILEAVKRLSAHADFLDTAVPRAHIPEFLQRARQAASHWSLELANWGHAADGNIHLAVYCRDADPDWPRALGGLTAAIYSAALDLGGAIASEHGIGCLKRAYLGQALEPGAIEIMRRVKAAFDPRGLLNPGKVLP